MQACTRPGTLFLWRGRGTCFEGLRQLIRSNFFREGRIANQSEHIYWQRVENYETNFNHLKQIRVQIFARLFLSWSYSFAVIKKLKKRNTNRLHTYVEYSFRVKQNWCFRID
jgi:hypothetical protein